MAWEFFLRLLGRVPSFLGLTRASKNAFQQILYDLWVHLACFPGEVAFQPKSIVGGPGELTLEIFWAAPGRDKCFFPPPKASKSDLGAIFAATLRPLGAKSLSEAILERFWSRFGTPWDLKNNDFV